MDLTQYGLSPAQASMSAAGAAPGERPARVTAVHKERFELISEAGACFGRLKAGVYYKDRCADFPTVGDFVLLQPNPSGDSVITQTLPRRSYFARKNPTLGEGAQAVAANFDFVFIMQSLNCDLNPKRLERYLTLAWQSGATPVVLLTKSDLVDSAAAAETTIRRAAVGADVFAVSAKTGAGFSALSDYLRPGKTVVLLGSSGVGKSSFVNALAGETLMAVNAIREDDSKGRHTTTHRQLIRLESGLMIIDTPGMRELGMLEAEDGLGEAFADVERYFDQCRFSDCRHESEPGCAVKAAIERGDLPQARLDSYKKLAREARYAADQAGYLREKQKRFSEIAKFSKSIQRTSEKHGGRFGED